MLAAPLVLAVLLAASPATADCTATDAQWQWGFKESFRAYVSGSIAQGEWSTTGGVGYETPAFFADEVGGELRLAELSGQLAVEGGMRFTGHAGILDTTIDDIRLRFDGPATVTVVADVVGTTQDFESVDAADVDFLSGDLTAAQWTVAEGALVIAEIPLTLTAAGAEAFGTYPQGEAFDPLTVSVTASEECAEQALAARSLGSMLGVLPWVILAVGALAGALVAVVGVRRRRSGGDRAGDEPQVAGQESGA